MKVNWAELSGRRADTPQTRQLSANMNRSNSRNCSTILPRDEKACIKANQSLHTWGGEARNLLRGKGTFHVTLTCSTYNDPSSANTDCCCSRLKSALPWAPATAHYAARGSSDLSIRAPTSCVLSMPFVVAKTRDIASSSDVTCWLWRHTLKWRHIFRRVCRFVTLISYLDKCKVLTRSVGGGHRHLSLIRQLR